MDPEQNDEQTAEQPNPDSGMVEVHQASIEDLDAALASAQAEEAGQASEAVVDDSSDQATSESQASEQPSGSTDSQATSQDAAAKSTVATQGAEASKPATQDELQATQAENERLRNEGAKKELFIKHRGNELGEVKRQLAVTRGQLEDARTRLATGIEDRWTENPAQAQKDQKRIDEIEGQIEAINGEESAVEQVYESQTFFLRHVDANVVGLEDLADVLKADGIGEEHIGKFRANPWRFTTPEALVQMGKRAFERKEFVKADQDRRILAKHIMSQNAELKKLRARPGQVVTQLQKSLNSSPQVTAQSTTSVNAGKNLNPASVPNMSDAELDRALAAAMH